MREMNNGVTVLDIGGSVVAPEVPDTGFLRRFRCFLGGRLEENPSRRAIIVIGGGAAARTWQSALRKLEPDAPDESLDRVGIMATRLNAELVRAVFGGLCPDPVVTDPTADFPFTGRILTAAGWKPGFSTDYDAVVLAERFSARRIIMLSNIPRIYSDDPSTNPKALPLDRLTWKEYRKMIGTEWKPGANLPFDPAAAERAAESGLTVVAVAGKNLENLEALLAGRNFIGTVIGP